MFRGLDIFGKYVLGCGPALAAFAQFDGAQAMQFMQFFTFKANQYDGGIPTGSLIADKDGNLYGTTLVGGTPGSALRGTVFRLAPDGTETVVYSFGVLNDGLEPQFGVTMDKAGNLYGTTTRSDWNCCGTVFKVAPDGTETILYFFTDLWADGSYGRLIVDNAGNLYGTTFDGGGRGCFNESGCGTVFKLAPDGTETTLYAFRGAATGGSGYPSDGSRPVAGVVMDEAGNLYGTTSLGGSKNLGTVFRLAPDGTETVIHSFKGGADGAAPFAELLRDKSGNLYGTTAAGGGAGCTNYGYGCGTVFRIAPDGTESVLYAFKGGSDAGYPVAPLIMDRLGNVYGTTNSGFFSRCFSPPTCGTAFMLAPDGTETVLHTFTVAEGGPPNGGLYMDKAGNLFGAMGGYYDSIATAPSGTIFELKK